MNIEQHISIQSAIEMAAPGPNGKIVLLDSDGTIQACPVLEMKNPPAPPSVTMLFVDVCAREDLTWEEAVNRIGHDCREAGISVYHLVHSTSSGVLSLREEYEESVTSVYICNGGNQREEGV